MGISALEKQHSCGLVLVSLATKRYRVQLGNKTSKCYTIASFVIFVHLA